MKLGPAEIIICKILLALYVFSLAFFDKSIFLGYDSPHLYLGLICIFSLIVLRRNQGIVLPDAAFFWLLFLFALLLSSFFAFSYERILSNAARLISVLAISLAVYNLLRSYRGAVQDGLKFYLMLSLFLAVFGMLQFIEFNRFQTFNLYLPATNLQFIAAGGPGAVAGSLSIFRATGTFAEPSWLAFFLVPATILSMIRYLQSSVIRYLILTLILFCGLICTLSLAGLSIFALTIFAMISLKAVLLLRSLKINIHSLRRFAYLIIIILIAVTVAATYITSSDDYVLTRLNEIAHGQDPSSEIRIATANQALHLFERSPLIGVGAGNYPFAAFSFLGGPADVSINSGFLLILAEMGIIGLVTIGLVFWGSLYPLLRHSSPISEQLLWLLVCDGLLLIAFNWWYHPLLWLHLTIPLAMDDKKGS